MSARLRPSRSAAAAGAIAVLLAGCGNERTPAPDVTTPATPRGTSAERFDEAGIRFSAPAGWELREGDPPLVASITSGRATISIFRYPRTEPLPQTAGELDDALDALVGAAKQRDPSFAERSRDRARVDGQPAVVLRGTQTVADQPRTVRSTHVYAFAGELVVDAMAPARDFRRADAEAFRPLVRSLRLAEPQG